MNFPINKLECKYSEIKIQHIIKMNAEQISSGQNQQVQSQQSRDLTQLKKRIELSNVQLHELTYNDEKFLNHINQLNAKGVQSVNNQDYKQAVIYFNENEKILEYAASCGKTMDRSIIVVTLHNQACINQKLWDLQKSANYIEAIIYNINFYFQSTKKQEKRKDSLQGYCEYVYKKQLFALYHLQFCAINSQIRKHTISLNSAKTAIKIMKQVCKESFQLSQNVIYDDLNQINQAKKISLFFKQLSNLQQDLMIKDYQKYFGIVKDSMLQKSREKNSNQEEYKNVRNFSIGKLMQLTPVNLQDLHYKESAKQWIKKQNLINIALYLGVCYFTVGTQLRFISSQNSQEDNQVYKLSEDFLISEVYHIFAIMIVLKYVPTRSIFLNHLLTSFNSHYEIDLQKVISFNVNNKQQDVKVENKGNQSLERQQKQKTIQQIYSRQNSVELPMIASLPQESQIKQSLPNGNTSYRNKNQAQKYEDQNKDFNKANDQKQLYKFQKKQKQNHQYDQGDSRSKTPNLTLKNTNKTKKSKKKSNEQMRQYTLTSFHFKTQKQKHQNSIKNRNSKSKSDYRKSIKSKKKNSDDKICIYTTKNKRDRDGEGLRSDQQKASIQKLKIKTSRDKSANKSNNLEVKLKSKSKQKLITRNTLGKQQKKIINIQVPMIMSQKCQKNKKKSISKDKKKNKLKMHKVQGTKH